MRPRYESYADRAAQERIIQRLQTITGLTAHSMPDRYPVDAALAQGKQLIAFVEIKARDHAYMAFATYILSLAKWASVQRLAEFGAAKTILVVKWTDDTRYCVLPDYGLEVTMGGRDDRGDAQDMEPVAHIPIDQFRPLEGLRETLLR